MPAQIECIRGNVLGTLTLADVCQERDLHMTYFGTGCIFHYDDDFTVGSGKVCAWCCVGGRTRGGHAAFCSLGRTVACPSRGCDRLVF